MEIRSRMPTQVIVLHVPTKQRPTAFRKHTHRTRITLSLGVPPKRHMLKIKHN